MFCYNCGKQMEENAKFCCGCGCKAEVEQKAEVKQKVNLQKIGIIVSVIIVVIAVLATIVLLLDENDLQETQAGDYVDDYSLTHENDGDYRDDTRQVRDRERDYIADYDDNDYREEYNYNDEERRETHNDDREINIAILAKRFCQVMYEGMQSALESYYGVTILFGVPPSEADIHLQVDMFNEQLARDPDAIALAALSTEAVLTQLEEAYFRGIPVIGFDSGVPDAPAGQVLATASTDNQIASAIGAYHMFTAIEDAIATATSDAPVAIAILSQDLTSEAITDLIWGFAGRMYILASSVNSSVAIIGDFGAINTGNANAAVRIEVIAGATSGVEDMIAAASTALAIDGLIGLFCTNEGAASPVLNAIGSGAPYPAGVQIVGFGAGVQQRDAVRFGLYLGAITQDLYQIGYQTVSLAVAAARGQSVSDIDAGAIWWDVHNMDDPDIARLLYD